MTPTKKLGTKRYNPIYRDEKISNICQQLREIRESLGLSQKEVAQRSGKKRNVLCKIEKEGGNITLKTLLDIVEGGLGGSVDITIEINYNSTLNI